MFIVLFIAFHMLEMDRTEDFQGFKRQELCEFSGVCVFKLKSGYCSRITPSIRHRMVTRKHIHEHRKPCGETREMWKLFFQAKIHINKIHLIQLAYFGCKRGRENNQMSP